MHQKLIGYKWEGTACLISFTLALIASRFVHSSMLAVFACPILSFFGFWFGISYIRTWKPIYRNILLTILLLAAIAFYAAIILPAQYHVR